jgi:hypothetical protein
VVRDLLQLCPSLAALLRSPFVQLWGGDYFEAWVRSLIAGPAGIRSRVPACVQSDVQGRLLTFSFGETGI